MIICTNCGGELERDDTKCPYCGYINMEGAEKKFRADIDEIRSDIEKLEKEPGKAFRKGLGKGVKVIICTIGILLVLALIYGLILAVEMRDEPKMFMTAAEKAEASAYRAVAKEQLEEAYENQDIMQLAEIFDKARSQDRVDLWGDPHYFAAEAASKYRMLMQCLPNLDQDKIERSEAEEITYDCFYFYYRAYGEDGAPLFDSIRDAEIIPIIEDRLGFTIEDMEQFRSRVTDSGRVNRSEVYWQTRKYFKNYH